MKTLLFFCLATTAAAQLPSIYPLEGATTAAVTTDPQGNIYVVGQTASGIFPVTANAFQPTMGGGNSDAFISKFSPSGDLVWSTYFGGSGNDSAVGVAIDSAGNILVAGTTSSPDLPVLNAYQSTLGGANDVFALKLDPTGKILYCTYLGGSNGAGATGLAVDRAGAAYITGYNQSANFPGQTSIPFIFQAFVVKLAANGSLVYSYEPTAAQIATGAIAVDSTGSAYITGTFQGGPNNNQAFVLRLSPDGSHLLYLSQFGGSETTHPSAIAIDSTGSAYVAGFTTSVDFPALNPVQPTLGARPLWKSTDGGNTWTPTDNLPFAVLQQLVADPTAPRTLYAAASDTGVYKSTDGGNTWAAINYSAANTVALNPSNTAILFAGFGTQLYRSTDGGADWSLADAFTGGVTQVAIDPLKPTIVYAIPPDVVSTDGGNTWSALSGGVAQLLVDPVTEGTLYAYNSGFCCMVIVQPAMIRSTDGGATWQELYGGADLPGPVADPTTKPAIIYAGIGARSSDGGNTWTPLTAPIAIASDTTTAMATDPQTGAVYVAGAGNGQAVLDVSRDHGQTWTQLATPAHMPPISGIMATPGALYATSNSTFASGFVLKLSPDGSTVTYATYLGGHGGPPPFEAILSNQVTGIALDQAGNMVVAGYTLTPDFPTVNAAQSALTGSVDAFLTVISADGQTIDYSTYLGGATGAQGTAVAVDPQDNLIVAANTPSPSGFVAKFTVAAPATAPVITKVLNAASFQPPIESGSWVMIQGTNLANDTRLWEASDFNGNNLPNQLDGVSVSIDGIPAYVEYISPTQINVQAPSDSTIGPVSVFVTNNGSVSAPATAQLQSAAPAFFMSPTYNVYASVIPGYIPVTATAPAMPGDLVVLWCTGFGPTIPPTPAGTIVTGAPATATFPVVTVGGIQVPVVSSVMTPGTVGLYQITIRLPDNVPTGMPAIQASIDGAQTQSGVTLFVAPGAGTSSVTVQSSLTALTLGQSVTLTATVSPSTVAGTVTFFDGVDILGFGPLANGQATFHTSLLTAGAHSIVAFSGENESAPVSIAVRALPGSGFRPVQTATNFSATETIAVADFNNDGIPDLAVGQMVPIEMVGAEINTLAVLLGNGDGTFRVASQPPGLADYVVVTGDFNGDGITDLATPAYVYLGNGDGTFQDGIPLNLDFDGPVISLAVGDFNGDGKADLAWSGVANGTNAGVVGILPGNGDGTFGASINTNVANGGSIAIGDFNHDGLADLAVTQAGNSDTKAGIAILLGKGDGTFQAPALYNLNYSPNTNIAVADFNGDGRDDIVVGGYSLNSAGNAGGFISVFLSNPDGTLQNPATIPLSIGPSSLAVGDFNGDGHMDVAYTSTVGAPYTLLGNGDGTLQSPAAVAGSLFGAIAAGDFNRDGRTDLAGSFANTQAAGVEVLLGTAATQGSAAIGPPTPAGKIVTSAQTHEQHPGEFLK